MQISLNWLKDFVDLPKKYSPEELARLISAHSFEVDGVFHQADKYKNIVVGKILEIKKHPNADRLQIAHVDIGAGVLKIVCGAANIEVGQLVPTALVGAVLPASPAGGPGGLEIKETEVRGEKSSGMLCAEDELGLGDDHSGIKILDKKARVGQSLGEYLKLEDVVFSIDNKSITNRPDLWSHYGVARELAAFLGVKFKEYKPKEKVLTKSTKKTDLEVVVDNYSFCPRYMAVAMEGVKISPSPKWLEDRLIAAGMRPINNIVDITNYVMLELGQPLHAFDASLVKTGDKHNILVRSAKAGEIIETLDREKRQLDEKDIVITDGKKPIALAGVMGGLNSEISSSTSFIIIESANFNSAFIRKTAQKFCLRSESSMRFEKSLDPNLCRLALARAVELVGETSPGAHVSSDLIDKRDFELNQGPIELSLAWLGRFLGVDIEKKRVVGILEGLGFKVKEKSRELEVFIPSWRATRDIASKEDVAEEIARIYGYENIMPAAPQIYMTTPKINYEKKMERDVKDILARGARMSEVYNYSFLGEEILNKMNMGAKGCLALANPIASHLNLLRPSLAPGLAENLVFNQPRFEEIAIFEIGSIYLSSSGDINKDEKHKDFLPYQEKHIGLAATGADPKKAFLRLKGMVEFLASSLELSVSFEESVARPEWADKNYFAEIIINDYPLGPIGRLASPVRRNLGLKKEAAIAEIDFKKLFNIYANRVDKKYSPSEKYPPAVRDLGLVVDKIVLYRDLKKMIMGFNSFVKEVELFDEYEGEKLGEGKKSLAFHIVYQADRTLTSEEVDRLQEDLIKELEAKFEAKVRDF